MRVLIVLIGVIVTISAAPTGGIDEVWQNLTALWDKVDALTEEINYHLHQGHDEPGHDQAVEEVRQLQHEHVVHHLHHPHPNHNDDHDADLLRHLEEDHGHSHHHDHTGETDPHPDGDHTHTHGGHGNHHHQGQAVQDHERDIHDDHGLHDHELYHHDHEHGNELHDHHHDDDDHHNDNHDHGSQEGQNVPYLRPGLALAPPRPWQDDSDEDSDENDHQHDHHNHSHHHDHHHHDHDHPHHHHHHHHDHDDDPWVHASCEMEPNVDSPESQVSGTIVISQRMHGVGPMYFDLDLSGFDPQGGGIHGFHIHERAVTDGSCGSTGGHFNPSGVTHGGPDSTPRHVGDLGNIEVDEEGNINGHIITDTYTAFRGQNGIIGKAIVVHAGEDDLGLGGDAGSLATGNAGGRLACCTIHMAPGLRFRFKG